MTLVQTVRDDNSEAVDVERRGRRDAVVLPEMAPLDLSRGPYRIRTSGIHTASTNRSATVA